jgi:hypothetical protein
MGHPGGRLFDFIAQHGCLFEVFLLDRFSEFLLERLQTLREVAGLAKVGRGFANVPSSFVHGFEQAVQWLRKGPVALRTAEAPGFLEICLGEPTSRATHFAPPGGLFDFL